MIMAAVAYVFTLARVAEMLGEDADWLNEISMELEPEDGVLYIRDIDKAGTRAYSDYGVESLKELINEYRRQGKYPKST